MTDAERFLYEELLEREGLLLRELSECVRDLQVDAAEENRLHAAARERVARLLLDAIAREKNIRVPP